MALDFVARGVFNDYLFGFIEQYCNSFPELKYVQEHLRDCLKSLIERSKEEIRRDATSASAVGVLGAVAPTAGAAEGEQDPYGIVLEMFIDSFKDVSERLKKCDASLIEENKCEFLQHLKLKKVWNDKRYSTKMKTQTWKYLNGAWLIAEFLTCVPPIVMTELEAVIRDTYTTITVESKEFDKTKFRACGKQIIEKIKAEDMARINEYFLQLIISTNTPIYAIVDQQYHSKMSMAIKFLRNPAGRKLILQNMTPMLKKVETQAGQSLFKIDEKNGITVDEKSLERPEEKPGAGKSKLFEIILDVFSEALEERKDLLNTLFNNPKEGVSDLFNLILPMLTEVGRKVIRGGSSGGDNGDNSRNGAGGDSDKNDEKYLDDSDEEKDDDNDHESKEEQK